FIISDRLKTFAKRVWQIQGYRAHFVRPFKNSKKSDDVIASIPKTPIFRKSLILKVTIKSHCEATNSCGYAAEYCGSAALFAEKLCFSVAGGRKALRLCRRLRSAPEAAAQPQNSSGCCR